MAFFVRVSPLTAGLEDSILLVANLAMLCETCIRIGSIDDLFGSLLDFKDRLAVAEKTQAVHKPMPALNRRIPHHKNWAALTSAAAEGCELCQLIFRHRPNSCSQDVQLYATLEGSIEHDLANGGSVCFSIEEPEEQNPTDFDLFVLAGKLSSDFMAEVLNTMIPMITNTNR